MLELLRIRNFVLIEEQEIIFEKGLNVFTGETGAGKSIILQALALILGARTKPGLIRKGADCWEIEALFNLKLLPKSTLKNLPEIVAQEDHELLLYRSAGKNGRTKSLVNGKLATLSMLEDIAKNLIHICGQGAFISLLDPKKHLEMLDAFSQLEMKLNQYQRVFARFTSVKQELEIKKQRLEHSALRRAELEYLVSELTGAGIEPGKREQLQSDVEEMAGAEHRIQAASSIEDTIVRSGGLLDQMRDLQKSCRTLCSDSTINSEIQPLADSIISELAELSASVNRVAQQLEVNPTVLEEKREELAEIARLERKFHMTDTQLAALLEKSSAELLDLDCPDTLNTLESEFNDLHHEVLSLAAGLTKTRQKKALLLCETVNNELGDLNMPDAALSVAFEDCAPNESGTVKAEFQVITNSGQEPQPLRQTASGGELSRILLVLKKVLRDKTGVNVLVFDEVDSGVSGKVARAMGEKLKSLASESQVLCITHLPQVASLADAHFIVKKDAGSTVETTIERLSEDLIVDEIARMLAGYHITDISRASARELLAS